MRYRERLGDLEQAEATFRAAESLDSSWPLTLMSLARYASDRGDAEPGLSLLRRAGATAEHELVVLLELFQPAPRPGLGRNHPWCGSGRKYKVCHLHREQLPLAERAAWLYQKAGAGLLEGPFGPLRIETAQARARYWDSPDALERAIEDGLACDAVLFEGGATARRSRIIQGRRVIGRRRLRRAAPHQRRPTRGRRDLRSLFVRRVSGLGRALFRAPIHLYRLGLGWLFGKRILLLNHTGRVSGKQRQVILEVVEHDPTDGSFVVASDGDPPPAWYRNILHTPEVSIQVGKTHDPRGGGAAHCRPRGRSLRPIRCPTPRRGDIPAPSVDGILSRRDGGRLPGGRETNAVRPVGYQELKLAVSYPVGPSRYGRYQRFVSRTFQGPRQRRYQVDWRS